MKQFGKILKFELKYLFKNKVFVGVTVFLVALIALVMFIPRITESAESEDISANPQDKPIMLIYAEDEEFGETVKLFFTEAFSEYDVRTTSVDPETIKVQITHGSAECAFVLTGENEFTYYVNDLSIYDMNTEIANEVLQNAFRMNAMIESGMSIEQAADIMNTAVSIRTENLGVDQMENYWYTYIMIFALYMVILLYGQMVATNVATEKSSRAMELLITSAKPANMMFGKVLASCIAGLAQLAAVFGSAILFYRINIEYWSGNAIVASIFDMPIELLGFMLVFFVLGFLIFAFLYGAVGSTVSKLEDINTSVMPITILFIVGFFVVMFSFASGEIDNMLMKVCSFIPFTSPMAMFTRIAMSNVPWYEIAISIGILIGSSVGIGFIAAKIYRVGVLLYGTRPKIGALIKAIVKKS